MKTEIYLSLAAFITVVMSASSGQTTAPTSTQPSSTKSAANNFKALNADDIKNILDSHNKARRFENATDMTNLTWNSELATIAQSWTDACNFTHQPPGIRKWGENMAAITNTKTKSNHLTVMIKQWVEEKRHNKGGTFEECCSFASSLCCHYTQVIWSRTTTVGCGYTACNRLTYGTGTLSNIAFLACYYNPTGNIPKITYSWRPYVPKVSPPAGQRPAAQIG